MVEKLLRQSVWEVEEAKKYTNEIQKQIDMIFLYDELDLVDEVVVEVELEAKQMCH